MEGFCTLKKKRQGLFPCSTALFQKNSHRAGPVLQEFRLVLRAGVWHSTSVVQALPWGQGWLCILLNVMRRQVLAFLMSLISASDWTWQCAKAVGIAQGRRASFASYSFASYSCNPLCPPQSPNSGKLPAGNSIFRIKDTFLDTGTHLNGDFRSYLYLMPSSSAWWEFRRRKKYLAPPPAQIPYTPSRPLAPGRPPPPPLGLSIKNRPPPPSWRLGLPLPLPEPKQNTKSRNSHMRGDLATPKWLF